MNLLKIAAFIFAAIFLIGVPLARADDDPEQYLTGTITTDKKKAKPGENVRFTITMHNGGPIYIYNSRATIAINKYFKTPTGGTNVQDDIWIPPGLDQILYDNETIAYSAPNGARAIA